MSVPPTPLNGQRTQRSSKKRAKRARTAEDDADERRFVHQATGFAIEDVGLVDEFKDTGQNLITAAMRIEAASEGPPKFPKTALMLKAERAWRLDDRARQAREDLLAGRAVEPSLELAIYLASTDDLETAGAVYLAHWHMVSALHDLIVKEREKYWTDYKSGLGADRRKELAKDFATAVAAMAAQVIADQEAAGTKRNKLKVSEIAREVNERLDRPKSDSTCWRYVRNVLKPPTKTQLKDLKPATARDIEDEPRWMFADELKALMERAGLKF
jgi:hypothetical protein